MDLNDYWQENKKFLTVVFAGVVLFLIGQMLINSTLASDLKRANNRIKSARSDLRKEMYTSAQLKQLETTNEQLGEVVATLKEAVAFVPRREFQLDDAGGRVTNQFFSIVTAARDDVLRLAGRQGVRLPDDLGLPGLSPTHEDEIVRTLEALDVIDRGLRLGIRAGVRRFESLSIKLDPALGSRDGVGALERTRVKMKLSGSAASLLRFLSATQSTEEYGQALVVEDFQLQPARRKTDEATLEVTFNVIRFHTVVELEG
jgi:hypothetical protein